MVEDVDQLLRTDAPFTRIGSSQLGLAAAHPGRPGIPRARPGRRGRPATWPGCRTATVRTVDIGTGALPVETVPVGGRHAPATLPSQETFWTRTGVGRLAWQPGEVHGGPYSLVVMSPGRQARHCSWRPPPSCAPAGSTPAPGDCSPSGTLLVMAGLIVLAWPGRRREVVYVVDPSQVPDLMKAIGAPLPLNRLGTGRSGGAHRPRTLADAQHRRSPALPAAVPQLTWPPSPPTAADYALATAIPSAGVRDAVPALARAAFAAAPAPSRFADLATGLSNSTRAATTQPAAPYGQPAAPAEQPAARAEQAGFRSDQPGFRGDQPGVPVGERSPEPGKPLSYIGMHAAAGPVSPPRGDSPSESVDPLFGRRTEWGGRRRAPDLADLPPFRASAVDAWVAETAPLRARETEAQAAARLAEAARARAAAFATTSDELSSAAPTPSVRQPADATASAASSTPPPQDRAPASSTPQALSTPQAPSTPQDSSTSQRVAQPPSAPSTAVPTRRPSPTTATPLTTAKLPSGTPFRPPVSAAQGAAAGTPERPASPIDRSGQVASAGSSAPSGVSADQRSTPVATPVAAPSGQRLAAPAAEPAAPVGRAAQPSGAKPVAEADSAEPQRSSQPGVRTAVPSAGGVSERPARAELTSRPDDGRGPSREPDAPRGVHPSQQRVSIVTGPRPTDWAATGLTRADSPRIGRRARTRRTASPHPYSRTASPPVLKDGQPARTQGRPAAPDSRTASRTVLKDGRPAPASGGIGPSAAKAGAEGQGVRSPVPGQAPSGPRSETAKPTVPARPGEAAAEAAPNAVPATGATQPAAAKEAVPPAAPAKSDLAAAATGGPAAAAKGDLAAAAKSDLPQPGRCRKPWPRARSRARQGLAQPRAMALPQRRRTAVPQPRAMAGLRPQLPGPPS